MNCDKTKKISELIDGELSADEAKQIAEHLADCAACAEAQKDFFFFREEIKSLAQVSPENERLAAPGSSWRKLLRWRMEFSFPIPTFVLLIAAALVFGAWARTIFRKNSPEAVVADSDRKSPVNKNLAQNAESKATSLARFDGGGRAEIYAARKVSPNEHR